MVDRLEKDMFNDVLTTAEELHDTNISGKIRKSKAQRIDSLFKVYKTLLKRKKKLVELKQPVMFLQRENMKDELYENVTKGRFEFQGSDGKQRFITIDPSRMRTLPFGNDILRYYVAHERYPLPLPNERNFTNMQFYKGIDDTLSAKKEWEAKKFTALGNMWWKIMMGIAVLVGLAILAQLMGFDFGLGGSTPAPAPAPAPVDPVTTVLP